MAETIEFRPGFADPGLASQRVFRAILDAMARPGRIGCIAEPLEPPQPLSRGATALCLALADNDTPLWLAPEIENPSTAAYLRFHCGSPLVNDPAKASFAVASGDRVPPVDRLGLGDDAWPESSTTLIVQVDDLSAGAGLRLTGPGIETEHRLSVVGIRSGFWDEWRANGALFPRGIDLVLVAGDRIAALPRTTAVRLEE